jgi:putative membrane protein
MAAVGIGLGFNALFVKLYPSWAPKAIATSFLMIAILIFVSAERRARRVVSRLEAHAIADMKPVRMRLLTGALVLATSALIAAIWLLA